MFKKCFVSFVLILILNSIMPGQIYRGEYDLLFFNRETSSAAEATGKIHLQNWNDASTSLSNPAYTGNANYVGGFYSYTSDLYSAKEANQVFYAVNIPIKNFGNFSLSRWSFDFGQDIPITTRTNPYGTGETIRPKLTNYNITYAKVFFNSLGAGIGINYFADDFLVKDRDYFSFNISANYKYIIDSSELSSHNVFLVRAYKTFFTLVQQMKILFF
ncbi:MAG: hypothetical protein K9J16_02005 [Melioribacteraceae bacterium]|nr:hypothetical protein [Melioribacteraceae bacterium]MCF8353040.1 hypothetical protein [Melioribacteraceae bacterium]MCF8392931.1 hypothetical protein [Melioribacteraceae bacterium]MCF8417774.1 hypothetical protein [Melioribacteraceae bacterium]